MKLEARILWVAALIFTLVSLAKPTPVNARQTSPTAQQIVEKMLANYANCKSYMDSGRVERVIIGKNQKRTTIKPFSTSFIRPDAFRFEYQERSSEKEWKHYIVWQKGSEIKSWWTLRPTVKEFNSLSMALAGPTGISGGSAVLIPSLLMPDSITSNSLGFMTELKFLGEERVGSHSAYKIEGQDRAGQRYILWIDKQRSLILKVFETTKFEANSLFNPTSEGFETETTTFYDPQINETVPAARLEFGIPTK